MQRIVKRPTGACGHGWSGRIEYDCAFVAAAGTTTRTANVGSSGIVGIERGKPMEARAGMIAGRATYTVDEVAVLLDLSRGNAYRYVREGVIPAKRVGRRWMVPRKAF